MSLDLACWTGGGLAGAGWGGHLGDQLHMHSICLNLGKGLVLGELFKILKGLDVNRLGCKMQFVTTWERFSDSSKCNLKLCYDQH